MKKLKNINIIPFLFVLLIILCFLQAFLNSKRVENTFDGSDGKKERFVLEEEIPIDEDAPDIYELTGYIFTNSKAYTDRLKTEINNMANDKSDNDHLYAVAESIRINEINYYTMLNGRYEEYDEELIEACKGYVFNTEALSYNIMRYIEDGRTKYISRAMICISSENSLAYKFHTQAESFKAEREEREALAEKEAEAATNEIESLDKKENDSGNFEDF